MESPFKKFMKTMGLFILLALVTFIGLRYHSLKESGKLDDIWNLSKTKKDVVYTDGELADPYKQSNSGEETKDNSSSSDSNFFTEKQNYDDYYNKFNFDNFLLLYEGDQPAQETIIVINRLIKNINGLSTNSIGPADLEEYRLVLNQAKADVRGSTCNIEFGYATLNSVVNKLIITKK